MEDRMDILIVGASGFTGAQVCRHLARAVESGKWTDVTWGIAGRTMAKLRQKVVDPLIFEGLTPPPESRIVCVDNSENDTLTAAVGRAKLCLNCTGPYRFLGEAVVSACVEAGTDYIDLCGEPEFMQRMLLKYHEKAEAKGVLILHSCAFDSVPADIGCLYAAQQFKSPSVCSQIASYLSINIGPAGYTGHATTFEAAVHGFGSAADLRRLRKEVQAKYPPPKDRAGPFFEEAAGINEYCFRFPGADSAVVRSTQNALAARGQGSGLCPYYSAYFSAGNWWGASQVTLYGSVFQTLARTAWGRSWLLSNPGAFTKGWFSHEGPTDEQMSQASFEMTFVAKGYSCPPDAARGDDASTPTYAPPDMTVVTRVKGPEPGYVATPIIFLSVARCLLEERETLPVSGGVHSPGSALVGSSLVQRLGGEGIAFEVVHESGDASSAV